MMNNIKKVLLLSLFTQFLFSLEITMSPLNIGTIQKTLEQQAEIRLNISTAVLEKFKKNIPINCWLNKADEINTIQAIAHACDSSFIKTGEREYLISDKLPKSNDLRMDTLLGWIDAKEKTKNNKELTAFVFNLMSPYLEQKECGLDYYKPSNIWTTSISPQGLRELKNIIKTIDSTENSPKVIFSEHKYYENRTIDKEIVFESWYDCFEKLQKYFPISCTVNIKNKKRNGTIKPCSIELLPIQLQTFGINAGFKNGVLCCDIKQIKNRKHPAVKRKIIRYPIPHLLSNQKGTDLAKKLEEKIEEHKYYGVRYVQSKQSLLIASDSAGIKEILKTINKMEESKGDF